MNVFLKFYGLNENDVLCVICFLPSLSTDYFSFSLTRKEHNDDSYTYTIHIVCVN